MKAYTHTTKFNWQKTYSDLVTTFSQWGVNSWHVFEPKMKSVKDWGFDEDARRVHIRFELRGKTVNLKMDKQRRAVDNFRVLYIAIEDMRIQERRGISEIMESAYLQINAPVIDKDPYDVLGLPRDTALPVCEAQYRELAKKYHTDLGGSPEKMKELNEAIENIRKRE